MILIIIIFSKPWPDTFKPIKHEYYLLTKDINRYYYYGKAFRLSGEVYAGPPDVHTESCDLTDWGHY